MLLIMIVRLLFNDECYDNIIVDIIAADIFLQYNNINIMKYARARL